MFGKDLITPLAISFRFDCLLPQQTVISVNTAQYCNDILVLLRNKTIYSRMDQVNFFTGCVPKILFGPFLNTLTQILVVERREVHLFGWPKLVSTLTCSKLNPFDPNVTFHIETSHLICNPNQVTGFCKECNVGLKWINQRLVKSR